MVTPEYNPRKDLLAAITETRAARARDLAARAEIKRNKEAGRLKELLLKQEHLDHIISVAQAIGRVAIDNGVQPNTTVVRTQKVRKLFNTRIGRTANLAHQIVSGWGLTSQLIDSPPYATNYRFRQQVNQEVFAPSNVAYDRLVQEVLLGSDAKLYLIELEGRDDLLAKTLTNSRPYEIQTGNSVHGIHQVAIYDRYSVPGIYEITNHSTLARNPLLMQVAVPFSYLDQVHPDAIADALNEFSRSHQIASPMT